LNVFTGPRDLRGRIVPLIDDSFNSALREFARIRRTYVIQGYRDPAVRRIEFIEQAIWRLKPPRLVRF
jgi:hypothetical protein